MQARIRRANPGDEAALALLGGATFLEAYLHMLRGPDIVAHCADKHAPARYAGWLADPAWRLWLAEAAETAAPVGYVTMGPVGFDAPGASPRDIELHRIYVLWRLRGAGLGQTLMQTALDTARADGFARVLIGVSQRNTDAIAFYQRLGFAVVGEREFQIGAWSEIDFVLGKTLD
jgi:ribosomal protein S18 acetylase RimI-like enzyme